MIVLRPFCFRDDRVDKLLDIAAESARAYGMPVEIVEAYTPPSEVTAYHDLVVSWWDLAPADRDLVIVEQDIAVHPNVLRELGECSKPWCGFENNAAGTTLVTTGCVKFSAELRRDYPRALRLSRRVGVAQDGLAAGHWARIDVRIFDVLRAHALLPHVHRPEVVHLRDATTQRMRRATGRTE